LHDTTKLPKNRQRTVGCATAHRRGARHADDHAPKGFGNKIDFHTQVQTGLFKVKEAVKKK
jgi:hypothetical protein